MDTPAIKDLLAVDDLLADVLAPDELPEMPEMPEMSSPLADNLLRHVAMLISDEMRAPLPSLRVRFLAVMEKVEVMLTQPSGKRRTVVAPTLGRCLELLQTPDEGTTLVLGENDEFLCPTCSGTNVLFDVLEEGEEPDGEVVTSPAGARGVFHPCPECGDVDVS